MKSFPIQCFLFLAVLVIIACSSSARVLPNQDQTQAPQALSETQSPLNSQLTPTSNLLIQAGTPYQMPTEAISASNVGKMELLARWVKGKTNQVAWSPDGNLLAVASSLGIYIYQAESLHEERLLKTTGPINTLAFSPDGNILASGSEDNLIQLWRASDGDLLQTLKGHTARVESVSFSPDGNILASGSYDDTVRLWRVSDGTLLYTLEGHTNGVTSVAFSPDGNTLASGSYDNTIRLWHVLDGIFLRTLEGQIDDPNSVWFYVRSVAFSPDGKMVASGLENGKVQLWRVSDGDLLNTLVGHALWVQSVTFSPDGNMLASGSGDTTIRVWRVSDGTLLRTISDLTTPPVDSVAFSPDGKILASGSDDGTVSLWGVLPTHQPLSVEGKIAFVGYLEYIINENGDSVLKPDVFVINTDGSNLVRVTNNDFYSEYSLRWSPDGKDLAFIGDKTDQRTDIYLYNLTDRNLLQVTQAGAEYPMWSPNGRNLLFTGASGGYLQIYDIKKDGTGQSCLTCDSSNVQSNNFDASWSPSGQKIAFISTRDSACINGNSCVQDIYIMNIDGTNQVRLTSNSSNIDYPIWSFDGKHIAYLSEKIDPPISVDICVMNADGSDNVCLAGKYSLLPGASGGSAHISPIGSLGFAWTNKGQIAAYLTDGTTSGIYLMAMNGSASFLFDKLPLNSGYSLSGSSDGNSIAIVTNKYRYNDYLSEADSIFMINTINGNKTFVFSDPKILHIQEPQLSP